MVGSKLLHLYTVCILSMTTFLFIMQISPCLADEDPVVIDYMVVYTPAAEELAGGEEAILTRISNGVTMVNEVLARSGLGYISYNLVHVQRLGGSNTSIELREAMRELYAFDSIRDLRDDYRADSVSILIERLSLGAYGDIPLSASQAHTSYTYFGVLNYGSFTTAHELGHNMGGFHDNPEIEPAKNTTAHGASDYGYTFTGEDGVEYKTIMSYGHKAGEDPYLQRENCGYYSNPDIEYQGQPTGRTGYADMASAIRKWAPIISNTYRTVIDPVITDPLLPAKPQPSKISPLFSATNLLLLDGNGQ